MTVKSVRAFYVVDRWIDGWVSTRGLSTEAVGLDWGADGKVRRKRYGICTSLRTRDQPHLIMCCLARVFSCPCSAAGLASESVMRESIASGA